MESLTFETAKIVGAPSRQDSAWAYTFSPEEEEKKRKRGTLLAAFSLRCQEAKETEVAALGKEVILRLHEEYYGQAEGSAFLRLKETIEKICQEFGSAEQVLQIGAAVLGENILYLAIFGEAEVWLKRGEVLSRILRGEPGRVQSASGFLQKGDWLVLGTDHFFSLLTEGVLKAALEGENPEAAVESISPLVHAQESSLAAALIGQAGQETPGLLEEKNLETNLQEVSFPPSSSAVSVFLGSFVSRVWGKIPRFSLGAIYLPRGGEEKNHRRMFLTIALILISLLAVSLYFGQQKRQEGERERRFILLEGEIAKLVEQGEALVVLNSAQSRQFLLEAQEKLTEAEKMAIEPEKTSQLKSKLNAVLSKVFREYRFTEVPLLTDLTLLTEGAGADQFSLNISSLAVLDRAANRIFEVETTRKSGEILLGGGTINQAKFLANSEEAVYVLEEEGIALFEKKSKKLKRGVVVKDKEWGEIAGLAVFGDNLYLFDRGRNQIWRYLAGEDMSQALSSRQSWFPKNPPELSRAVSFAIDGSIWFLTTEGKILKFTQGIPAEFKLIGLAQALASPAVIYTNEKTSFLYVLDRGNKRIVVFAKSGEYQAEYLWEGLKDITDMVVSEAEKKILLLAGSKIFEMELK